MIVTTNGDIVGKRIVRTLGWRAVTPFGHVT